MTPPLRLIPGAARANEDLLPIAVIGGGCSGTLAAIQLLAHLPGNRPVLLCERGEDFARGVAYATKVPGHLVNVRSANMSAFPDRPDHFQAWLEAQGDQVAAEVHATDSGLFASRSVYGQYLGSVLRDAVCGEGPAGRMRILPDEIVDIERNGRCFTLESANGRRYPVAGVVLATGHVPPRVPPDPRYCTNPWNGTATSGLDPARPVMILGSSLTMVDIALALRENGFPGPIKALSRGGLAPRPHRPTPPWPTPALSDAEKGSIRILTRRVREEIRRAAERGVDWRAVIDSLRPITAPLWTGLSEPERRRFLRHVRRWWDVHRHRLAPPNAASLNRMRHEGSLEILAGRICGVWFEPDRVRVAYHPLGGGNAVELDLQRVIVATGLDSIARTGDPLTRRLMARGMVRLDPLGLGIDVTPDLEVLDPEGNVIPRLWALGPIVRGVFWECIAVPDIRLQAAALAATAAATISLPQRRQAK
jgi:uncharacterized NAD(P)/FAD-binding protein YdhS